MGNMQHFPTQSNQIRKWCWFLYALYFVQIPHPSDGSYIMIEGDSCIFFFNKIIQKLCFCLLKPTETEHDWWGPCSLFTAGTPQLCLWGAGQHMPVTGSAITKQPGRWFDIFKYFGAKVQDLGSHLSKDTSREKNTSLKGTAGPAF